MLPIYLDINPSQAASTTLNKPLIEFSIQTLPTYVEQGLLNVNIINGNLISVFTNVSLSSQQSIGSLEESSSMDDDFDILSKFDFKKTKTIKARLKKTQYTPSIIVD